MDALTPENSTDLPDDQDSADDPATDNGGVSTPDIQMDSNQVQDSGLSDAQPGDEFTLKITVTNTDEGLTASVVPGSAQKVQKDLAPMARGKQNVKGPADMGFTAPDEGFDIPQP